MTTGDVSFILHQFDELETTPSGRLHAKRHDALKRFIYEHQESGIQAIITLAQRSEERATLLWALARDFGCHAEGNYRWHQFQAQLRMRQVELPIGMQRNLDWLLKVHGW